ncbi:unnamed protein product [Haemonchus placei]|uniref:Calmodulin n=1 Tax=Haemonchus placei TaxID=6290 RepID=A0A0N4WP51_HAEPC|nr:unnamed protein product [Haemonchus placei]
MTHSHDGHLTKVLSDDEVEKVVDLSMDHMDLDRDGFVSFAEYKKVLTALNICMLFNSSEDPALDMMDAILPPRCSSGTTKGVRVGEFEFGDDKAIHDEAHMKEHLKDKIEIDAPRSEAQKRFHYFWINDLNHDGKLDGLEILKSMIHSHDGRLSEVLSDEQVEKVVDKALNTADVDRDGLVTFAEFKKFYVLEIGAPTAFANRFAVDNIEPSTKEIGLTTLLEPYGRHNFLFQCIAGCHMKEHLKDKIGIDAPMSEEQKRFNYFWINDLNHDGQLDGLEILKSMLHSHDGHLTEVLSDEQVENLVDLSLNWVDLDRDGLVSFAEYKKRVTESN